MASMYNQFFYLPKECPKGSKSPLDKPSVARLDRMFSTHVRRGCRPTGIKLAPMPLGLLLEMVRIRFGGAASDDFKTVQQLFLEQLPSEAMTPVETRKAR